MSKQNLQSIGTAIDQFLKENRLEKKIDASSLHINWKMIAGDMIANHTKRLFLKETTLYLEVDSAELKNEIHFLKDQLIQNVNHFLKKDLIKQLVLI
jgi:predicted nucleic acid-binding Zn ribbon protein